MGHALMLNDPSLASQFGQAAPALIGSGHAEIVGHGHEQRPLVKIARLSPSLDLEDRPARRGGVDDVTVVDDTFKDGEGADAHPTVLAQMADNDPNAVLAAVADEFAGAVEAAVPGWVERCVSTILNAWQGEPTPTERDAARDAGHRAASDVGSELRALLAADVDEQHTTPLSVLRGAVRYPTEVLTRAGVPPVEREAFAEASFPDDIYDLTPATFADVDPALVEPAIRWGAAKAFVHKRRHGS